MKKKFSIAVFFTAVLFCSDSVMAEKLIIGAVEDLPPFQYVEAGKIVGIGIDITHEICKRLGIEAEFQAFPFKRYLYMAEKGEVNCLAGASYTEERAKFLYFCSEPVHVLKTAIFIRKGSGLKLSNLIDLKDKNVGVVRGYTYGAEFDKLDLKKTVCNDENEMIRIFRHGRVDFVAAYEDIFSAASGQQGFQGEYEIAYTISERKVYHGFSKIMGDRGKELAEKFSMTLRQMKEDLTYQKIVDNYLRRGKK